MLPGITAPAGGTTHFYTQGAFYGFAPNTIEGNVLINSFIVQKIPPLTVSQGGAYMRITLWSPASDASGVTLDSVWVGTGNTGSGNIYNFDAAADQVQVAFSNYAFADATKPVITNDKDFVSDDIHFAFDSTKPLLIAYGKLVGEVWFTAKDTSGAALPTTYAAYLSQASNSYTQAGTTVKTGSVKAVSGRLHLIKKIEVSPA